MISLSGPKTLKILGRVTVVFERTSRLVRKGPSLTIIALIFAGHVLIVKLTFSPIGTLAIVSFDVLLGSPISLNWIILRTADSLRLRVFVKKVAPISVLTISLGEVLARLLRLVIVELPGRLIEVRPLELMRIGRPNGILRIGGIMREVAVVAVGTIAVDVEFAGSLFHHRRK